MKREKLKRYDFLLLGGVVLVGCMLGFFLLVTGRSGTKVQVRVAGTIVETFPLNENLSYEIHGVGGGTNNLIIENGEAWIENASCPDGLCIHMGKIHRDKQSIVCLPNQVVVEVVGVETASDVDIVAK